MSFFEKFGKGIALGTGIAMAGAVAGCERPNTPEVSHVQKQKGETTLEKSLKEGHTLDLAHKSHTEAWNKKMASEDAEFMAKRSAAEQRSKDFQLQMERDKKDIQDILKDEGNH